jgi:hypothetical protein
MERRLQLPPGDSEDDLKPTHMVKDYRIQQLHSLRFRLVPIAEQQGVHADEDVFHRLGETTS